MKQYDGINSSFGLELCKRGVKFVFLNESLSKEVNMMQLSLSKA